MATSDEKTRYLGSFRGVDYSSDPSEVSDYRLSECVNMYKDYHSGQGQAIETVPGFRLINDFKEEIYGIHVYQKGDEKTLLVHAGKNLYKANVPDISKETTDGEQAEVGFVKIERTGPQAGVVGNYDELVMNEGKSTSFNFNNRIYILDGKNYIFYQGGEWATNVLDYAYVPTTHISLRPDGSKIKESENSGEFHQRNILNSKYKSTYVADGEKKMFSLPSGIDYVYEKPPEEAYLAPWEDDGHRPTIYEAWYPNNFKVIQYGIELPWADPNGNIPYLIKGSYNDENGNRVATSAYQYPNAILSISESGVIDLVLPPPLPENNTSGEINGIITVGNNFKYPAGYAGIEITATKKITTIKGITSSSDDVGSIITGCTIATVHDGKIFLSGNPDYPNFVFFNSLNPETGYSDPSYFGILDWWSEGVTNTPITSLMPIADTLMVLRKDTVQDGSVTFRSRVDTDKDLAPVVYTGSGGLPGVGCLGASCNFLDDPIFISKFGVEAMGQLSARYERAVEHRSSLIDGLLLNRNLAAASIAEFDGYMWLLVEGEIFLADSRQRYTHSSGVMQYEWFYLNDIGVYDGQSLQAVYADLSEKYKGHQFKRYENGETTEYTLVTIEDLKELNYDVDYKIGDPIEESKEVLEHSDDDGKINFVAYGNYAVIVMYAEYFVGGEFDPAMLIKTVDHDKLMFGTKGGKLCVFNFDKRDPNDDYKIPNKWYSFNNRVIKCGLVTKMDNCGIPHLVKNTVKKSMVIKMRSFPKSAAKIRVRTNRQPMHEVERIYGGLFDGNEFIFSELSYDLAEKYIFRVREKEKKWLEKQLYIISDEYKLPFALHYIAYGYVVSGRYKD